MAVGRRRLAAGGATYFLRHFYRTFLSLRIELASGSACMGFGFVGVCVAVSHVYAYPAENAFVGAYRRETFSIPAGFLAHGECGLCRRGYLEFVFKQYYYFASCQYGRFRFHLVHTDEEKQVSPAGRTFLPHGRFALCYG